MVQLIIGYLKGFVLIASFSTGHDINLVKILINADATDRRLVDCGDISFMLKDSDPRLSKTLTLA